MIIENPIYQNDLQRVVDSIQWESFAGNSFLVIGASGMIGSFMIDVIMKVNNQFNLGISVIAMGRNKERLEKRFSLYLEKPEFMLYVGDITEPLSDKLQADYLIHGASNTHPKAYATDPIGTIMTNLMGTEVVLKHAVKINANRVLFLSTVEVYGQNYGDKDYFDEDYCGYINCNTLRAGYPEGKRVSESLCQAFLSKYGVSVVIPRLSRVFGPTMLLGDTKASSQFIINAARGEDIVLKSDGEQFFSYIYVGDAVAALFYLLKNGVNGEAYNIAGGLEYDFHLRELAEDLATIGASELVFELPDEVERTGFSKVDKALMSIDKITDLGWSTLFTKDEALNHTVEILRGELSN